MIQEKKYKILMLSDHALSTSGVGCQSRFLIEGLIEKGCWTVRQFGAALKHENYNLVKVNQDFIIKPIDGFGNRDMIIQAIITEKPDVVLIFTDPRFFSWLFHIEDEVRSVCPIAYWHVWDNAPYPAFNDYIYEATDLINCHSHLTYDLLRNKYADKTNFVPHTLPPDLFHPLDESIVAKNKADLLGPKNKDSTVFLWVNRNARRKRPADLLWAWSKFLSRLSEQEIKKEKPLLLMHTDPRDSEGPNLLEVANHFGISDSVVWSNQRLEFDKMNIVHNISDVCINISYAEGFGLSTLEAMNCGNPIIALKTGGLTRQVVDHRDGSENGIALEVEFQSCVGNQSVHYIYEDYVSCDSIANAMHDFYKMSKEERKILGNKARNYALSEFNHQKMLDDWHKTLLSLIEEWPKKINKRWECLEIK